ncbi:flagellar basal body-associated FliL family protein [Acidisoma silvae]|uniref:Flagellar protein FliL n=1 Tax=Acidisoma silvae TaxID=2802396 RepID=A0A963YQ59_9PROT|nr:flagellar basal body-associated FliL family protein [Acidisoma silvae]MCB8874900.1 flagellar basal body-associated FliL family protein [Acidisoma silvae]
MRKILVTAAVALVSLLVGIGGTLGVTQWLFHAPPAAGNAQAAIRKPEKPVIKPTFFASLADVTVSIPPQPGLPATSYVVFSVKFATNDQAALVAFDEMQPVIKSAIITRLLNETTQSLQSQQSRTELMTGTLSIVNNILNKNLRYNPPNPFTAAYIANLVTQD